MLIYVNALLVHVIRSAHVMPVSVAPIRPVPGPYHLRLDVSSSQPPLSYPMHPPAHYISNVQVCPEADSDLEEWHSQSINLTYGLCFVAS